MLAALRWILPWLAWAVPLAAYDFAALVPQGYVSDFSTRKVVDEGSRAELERYAAAVEKSTGAQMAFVVIDSLEGEPIEDVANTIYRKWGVGSKKNNEGLLLLLAVNDRRHRLEIGYGLEPILPDGFDGSVLRAMRDRLRSGNYGEALLDAAHTLGNRIAEAKNVQIAPGQSGYRPRRVQTQTHIPWGALIVGAVILLVLVNSSRGGGSGYGGGGGGGGSFLTGMLLGNLLSAAGRRGGGWSAGGSGGGGFGGYDSGDSFGGFGGGDSGGGGASSDW